MSHRLLPTLALAGAATLTVIAVPLVVPGKTAPVEAKEHREVRRTVRRVRRSAEEAPQIERTTRRSVRRRTVHTSPLHHVQLDRSELTYESFGNAGRAIAHRGHDGEQDGYRLSAIRASSISAQLGLRNGDVVTHVGGIPLTSMDRAVEAWQAVQHASEVTLQLVRAGRAERIVIELG